MAGFSEGEYGECRAFLPMTCPDNLAGVWELPKLSESAQKAIAKKLGKSYMKAGFKPFFKGSSHLFLTHFRHPTATKLIDTRNEEQQAVMG